MSSDDNHDDDDTSSHARLPLRPPRPFFFPNPRSSTSTDDDDSDRDTPSTPPTPSNVARPPRSRPHRTHNRRRSSVASFSNPTQRPLSRGPPPSSFAFPFQSYPGNPDPGTPIPGVGPRRYSFHGLPPAAQPSSPSETSQPVCLRETHSAADLRFSGTSPVYRNSAAGAIVSGTVSDVGHASGSATISRPRSNSQTFRSPFLSPASRPSSSLWAPPSAYPSRFVSATPPVAHSAASSALVLALPKSKPPLPSTALPAKLAREDKPWLAEPDRRSNASWWLTFLGFWFGVAAAAVLCWRGVATIYKLDPRHLCLILDDQFDSLDTDNTWTRDVEMGGFGNNEFQMTTALDTNSYVQNGNLYIMPTLTSDIIGYDHVLNGGNYTLDHCTVTVNNLTKSACSARSDGTHVISPVMSARLNTKGKYSIQYGKVEVRAKLPRGDWLWPAIWMLSEDESYGGWPLSGEMDIMEARGNGPSYPAQGVNVVRSSLHYGPLPDLARTLFGWVSAKRAPFNSGFHVYALEWDAHFMRFYVDSRVRAILTLTTRKERESFWERGQFPGTAVNGSGGPVVGVANPWSAGGVNAPFDRPFYLVLDVAAGGTSGWFPDGVGEKPWEDQSETAMLEFASAQDQWYATWPQSADDRAFRVDYVKMWKKC